MRTVALASVALALTALTCGGCATTSPDGSGAGSAYRGTWSYRYYPQVEVYFAEGRGIYYWLDKGVWIEGRTLPRHYAEALGTFVRIDLDTDEPYEQHQRVRQDHPRTGPWY